MKKLLTVVVGVLLALTAAFCAWKNFGGGIQEANTNAHPDKGSYSYYYSPPEDPDATQEPSGIYFYSAH